MKAYLSVVLVLASYWHLSESVLCEIGEALKDPNNPELDRNCNNGCPNNYVCMRSNVLPAGVCCRSKATICALPPAQGAFCGSITASCQKWYYDPNQRRCFPMTYNGCFGNLNNFYSQQECQFACLQTITPTTQMCPAGSNPQQGTNVQTPCNMTPFMACQQGYVCQWSQQLQRSYCCSSNIVQPQQFCPAGYNAAPGTTAQSICSNFAACPNGYTCMQSTNNGQWYCCSQNQVLNQNTVCRQGGTPVMYTGTNQAVACMNGQGCQVPYTCQSTGVLVQGQQVGVCCSQTTNTQTCPQGLQPYRPQGQTLSCISQNTIIPSMCPQPSTCQASVGQYMYICCIQANRSPKLNRQFGVSSFNETTTTDNSGTN